MKEKDLRFVEGHLRKALEKLDEVDIADKEIAQKYAVYLVALKLAEKGYDIMVPAEEGKKGRADLYIPQKELYIEVKSGRKLRGSARAGASFRDGRQISQKLFSHCVFLTFERNKVEEILVFNRDELVEVASKPRKNSSYSGTNPCILFRYNTLDEARSYVKRKKEEALLDIEVKLHKHPEDYKNKWDKILP